ncbi:MAG TPA: phenylacetate-CoA oxygenase subunit PaaJ, partial [Cyclobacteriaceae bacterium]|nr:phenylacetate-CoA oxygenase subunit PaaJ [Cyclobacteriaceae bacterium]
PAIDYMKQDVKDVLAKHGIKEVEVDVNFKKSWSSDKLTEKGRQALKSFGLAPPPQTALINDIDFLEHVACPRCDGKNTELRNPFGPTLCRSIHYCLDCREAFEQFKPL